MHKYKKFFLLFLVFIVCFFLLNVVVWKLYTGVLLTGKDWTGGDLTRMGYVNGSMYVRKALKELPRRHVEFDEYKGGAVDVVVVGDSFSNGGGHGFNSYYQDYIASFNNLNVLNLPTYDDLDFITQIACYANNGFLERIKARYVIISSVERSCAYRFSRDVDLYRNNSMAELAALRQIRYKAFQNDGNASGKDPLMGMFNEGNFKFLLYKVCYLFSDHAFFSKTYKKRLNAPFFSVKDSSTLLFFCDDVKSIGVSNPATIARMNDNLNRLADKLARKGIKLYFMPCVDKYDLYSEFIVNNNYPKSSFFELLRPLPKRYALIDTKAILLPEVKKGVKDVFYADDTHWTWKASEKIFRTVRFERDN